MQKTTSDLDKCSHLGNLNDFETCSEFFGGGLLLKAQLKRSQNSLEHVEANEWNLFNLCTKIQSGSCRGSGGMKPKKRRGEEEKEDQGVFPRSSTPNAKCNCSPHKHNISILSSDPESRHL
ncbi:hypothetical protein BJ165DRAFT_1402760 [Panaeolus papilionaceus]|nr:hypothetical protein BJ165DRAFT_1402760 [Panaeolus papilionaceus]